MSYSPITFSFSTLLSSGFIVLAAAAALAFIKLPKFHTTILIIHIITFVLVGSAYLAFSFISTKATVSIMIITSAGLLLAFIDYAARNRGFLQDRRT